MKPLPFNACDYRCEHCLATADCAVFRKFQDPALQQRVREGDLNAVLQDVRESFRETEELIKLKTRELGIDIDEIAGRSSLDEIRRQEERLEHDPLFRRSYDFTIRARAFLVAAGTAAAGEAELEEYLDDIAWHHMMVTVKIQRALGWRMDDKEAIDARNSAAVAMKSLTICIMAFDELASRYPDLSPECKHLSAAAQELKQEIRARTRPQHAARQSLPDSP